MSAFVAMKECRRQVLKQADGVDALKWTRQQRRIVVRKFKKHLLTDRRPVVVVKGGSNRSNRGQLKEKRGLAHVIETLLDAPKDQAVQIELNSLCDNRPLEMVSAGALPIFVKGLISDYEYIKERATWCLAKLAILNMELRDAILKEEGVLAALKSNISRIKEWSCVFSCVNFMTSLLNHRTLPPFIVVEDWREFLKYIVMTTKPQDPFFNLVVQTAWAMACISKYTEMKFEPTLIAKMVTYLGHSNSQLLQPTLIALGNAVIRTTESAQAALDAGVLQHAKRLLGNERTQESTCYLLANIAAGTPEQMEMLFLPSIMPIFTKIADLVCGDYCFTLKSHALAVIVTVIKKGTDLHLVKMDELNCVSAVCEALDLTTDSNVLMPVLETLTIILDVCTRINFNYRPKMEERGVVDKLEELLDHGNRLVSTMCWCMLDKYFAYDEGDDDYAYEVPQENIVSNHHVFQSKELDSASEARGVSSFGHVNTSSVNIRGS